MKFLKNNCVGLHEMLSFTSKNKYTEKSLLFEAIFSEHTNTCVSEQL